MEKLDLSDIDRIKALLSSIGLNINVELRVASSDELDFIGYVNTRHVAKRASKNYTSSRQLEIIREKMKMENDIRIEWYFINDEEIEMLEVSLKILLGKRFPGYVQDVYIKCNAERPEVVSIELDERYLKIDRPKKEEIEKATYSFFEMYKVPGINIDWLNVQELPNLAVILRKVKILSPTSVEDIDRALKKSSLNVPSLRWLKNKLDTLRKYGLVLWISGEKYCLTERGNLLVPSGTTSRSSDVERVLDMARRKWQKDN